MNNKATYGIIGFPVEHSLSPLMHNAAFKELRANAVYKLFSLSEEELPDFFSELREKQSPIFGLNVTVPYKEKVIAYLDSLSPFAARVKAVNTILISPERKLVGYNTDGPGFLSHLVELKFNSGGKRICILGAGEDLNVELADLLLNTTSLGMKKTDECLIEEDAFHRDMLVYDVIYNPVETELLRRARLGGAQTANGLGMLFYQGVLAFQHWADTQLSAQVKEKMRAALQQGIPGGEA